ncbi:MAG TPA: cytochrome b/b6 domain-containing protein [Acidimicrobiales bacterium]|nr:cytochrome b/b6 domain-containing protein [Acidimicrobiales bacterium]
MTTPRSSSPTRGRDGSGRRPGAAPWSASRRILRFDGVERAAHWATALLFGILMATALPLYFVQVESLVGRRALVAEIHTWTGVALPIPLIISLAGPWGSRLRRDVRRFNLWTVEEIRWLRSLGRRRLRQPDKFNPGQKLNALFTAGAIVVMLGTGSILKWTRFFPLNWRTGATFVHDVLALGIFVVVFGHISFALTHREALRSMIRGWVTEVWASRHASAWLKELKEEEPVRREPDSVPTR